MKFKNIINQIVSLLLFSILLMSCSNNSGYSTASNNASASPQQAKYVNNGRNIFSSNRELSYVPVHRVYRINIGDVLDVKVFQADELTRTATVNTQGNITFPLIGQFRVQGLTQEQAEKNLASQLGAKYLQNPQVTIEIQKTKVNDKVTLEGWVAKPGIYPLEGDVTLLQSVALAAGLNDIADPTKVILFRKATNKAYLLNLKDIRNGQARDPYVQADDRIVVAKSGSRSFLKDASAILGGVFSPLRGVF